MAVSEGTIPNPFFDGDPLPPNFNPVEPILDYAHDTTGICVIGGYIYHAGAVPDLDGLYVFGDCFGPNTGDFTGRIFTLRYENGAASAFTDITSQLFPTKVGGYTLSGVTSMGIDASSEMYITTLGGDVFQIIGNDDRPLLRLLRLQQRRLLRRQQLRPRQLLLLPHQLPPQAQPKSVSVAESVRFAQPHADADPVFPSAVGQHLDPLGCRNG